MDRMTASPPPSANAQAAAATASYYDELWRKEPGAQLHATEVARVSFVRDCISRHPATGRLRLLDYGCGRAWMAPFLAPYGELTGADYSPSAIEEANRKYGAIGRFCLLKGDAAELVQPDCHCFDIVVCSEVLEHVPDQPALLATLASYLTRSGWLVLTTPNGNVWSCFSRDPRFRDQMQPVEKWMTTRELRRSLSLAGLRILKHIGLPYLDFRVGLLRVLQSARVERSFQRLRMPSAHGILIRRSALYQAVLAARG